MASQRLGPPEDPQSETEHLAAIINHVVLPPKLPQSEDVNLDEIEDAILRLARSIALTLPTTLSTEDSFTWQPVVGMLSDWSEIKQGGDLRDDILISRLLEMRPGDCLALHLTAQNSGLFLRRDHADSVIFECFEASPTSESVITTEGRLLRTFPGRAVACPASLLSDNHFRDQLATTLRRLNNEAIDICTASITKAGSRIREERDTTDPALVVDYLMNMLSALGENIESVPTQKCTRDDVLWSDTRMPWRRAPFWLILKVTVQRVLVACMNPSDAKRHYKMFMAALLARILDLALKARLPSDIVATIHTKLARRVYKFEKDFGEIPMAFIKATSQKARQFMDENWLEAQKKAYRKTPSLPLDQWENATSLTLSHSRPILTAMVAATHVQSNSSSFVPSSQTRFAQDPAQLPSLGLHSRAQYKHLVLADFESWVQNHLAAWTQLSLNTPSSSQACNELADLVRDYWTLASSQYKISPLEMSEALLVVHELWVALDKLCVARLPLLGEYPPEISRVSLQPLLLPKKEQMLRLDAVESHVDHRQTISCPVTSIFQNPRNDSFCVRYYDSSDEHKKIREKIAHNDAVKRRAKLEELTRLSAKYEKLIKDASELSDTIGPNRSGRLVHYSRTCKKCALNQEAKNMRISVDEKSLPENITQLKAAVFELATPPEFAAWRDVTWMIINDVGQRKTKGGLPKHVTLQQYFPLQDYIQTGTRKSRLTLASVEKSHITAHYRNHSFPVSEASVCVNNGLRYQVWDNVRGIWLSDSSSLSSLKSHCTLRLPSGPYANLEWASHTSSHSANEAIAKQNECDKRLRIREYVAFGSMRSGERIQWLNMLRELGCSDLDHNALAVNSLFLQAAWEAGRPSGDVLRQAHVEFGYPLFCRKLLFVLRNRIDAIEASWDEQQSMSTIIQLSLRLLSLSSTKDVSEACLELIRRARSVTHNWCDRLQKQLNMVSSQELRQQKDNVLLLSAALLCFSTFDVSREHLNDLLQSEYDLTVAAEINSIIHDHLPGDVETLPLHLQQNVLRRFKIAHANESQLKALLPRQSAGLTKAVQKLWHGVILSSEWKSIKDSQWMSNRTSPSDRAESQAVHYNLFTGELLVDGLPSGKVPENYKHQPLFQRILGPAILSVFASDLPGMVYRVARPIYGNEVHLSVKDGKAVIKARFDGRLLQLVPHDSFSGDLPAYFVNNFAHWLDETTGEIEFRPLRYLWQSSKANWMLSFSSLNLKSARAAMSLDHRKLVDHVSTLGQAVARHLQALDSASYIHIALNDTGPDTATARLEIDLHRYNLHFSVTEEGQLKLIEYNAVIDHDQSIGTLIGLQSKLVLRDIEPTGDHFQRSVLIPYGVVILGKTQHHVEATIRSKEHGKQRHFVYKLDRYLNKLCGAQDVLSSFHKAYLHAVTSYHLPDPFTHRTGTEEALANMREASSFTCSPLTEDAHSVLNAIAKLTPERTYYPRHKRVMQSVSWNANLSPLSQNDEFILASEAILSHNKKFSSLYPNTPPTRVLRSCGEPDLLERARKRHGATNKPGVFTGVVAHNRGDSVYQSRDRHKHNDRSAQVYNIAKLVKEWPQRLSVHSDLEAVMKKWSQISGYRNPFSVQSLQQLTKLKLPDHWGSLYELCRFADRNTLTYKLMFSFCAIAFGSLSNDLIHLRTLLAFAFSSSFLDAEPPRFYASYSLSQGWAPGKVKIDGVIRSHTNDVWTSDLTPPLEASYDDRLTHIKKAEKELDTQVDALKSDILSQWPAEKLVESRNSYKYISVRRAIEECQQLFNEWHKNRRFVAHTAVLQGKLNRIQAKTLTLDLPSTTRDPISFRHQSQPIIDLASLLQDEVRARTVTLPPIPKLLTYTVPLSCRSPQDFFELDGLVHTLLSSPNTRRKEYGQVLNSSLRKLKDRPFGMSTQALPFSKEIFSQHYHELRQCVDQLLQSIRSALSPSSLAEVMLGSADMWPRITKQSLLSQLSAAKIAGLTDQWKEILLSLGEVVARLQRSERLMKSLQNPDIRATLKELECPGRQGWSAIQYPSWLLFEIENNITIRPTQARVAHEMIMPNSRDNSVLQLNMGEGKSSVITPMVVVALANCKRLVRVIVLKPLLRQTEQLLAQRLGGLLNQRIYHTPFSRKTEIENSVVKGLASIYHECEANRGVLIALPEHFLSFRLMGREKTFSDKQIAASLLDVEQWLQRHCRDVLDESDEILDTHFQLVYTVGDQRMLDGQSDRWNLTQALLVRVKSHASGLSSQYPTQLEVEQKGNSFPFLRFLRCEIGEHLLNLLVKDIMEGQLGISFHFYAEDVRKAIERFIRDRDVSKTDVAIVMEACAAGQHHKSLLILRGLVAHGILLFALQCKRWLVEYGLDPSRCLMAVPYRAKGVPSLSSEYGHSDVAILLTCLSYYYTGLSADQIRQCFAILLKDSNAEDVYNQWATACEDMPANLVSLEAINLGDEDLCSKHLFPKLQFNVEVANFYLTKVVFPKEGKEFAKRISASGWDIPSLSCITDTKKRHHRAAELVTTGFSGTNDNRFLLPFSIRQGDMSDLQHTNAMVLDLILREENKTYVYAASTDDRKLGAQGLLHLLSKENPRIDVLIDVGAQVLEMTNFQVAEEWLNHVAEAKAAIYFDDNDEAMVRDRSGVICPLRISAFRARLKNCLIYLDEVHTRGIDLPIPVGARAAVTLGPRLIKDRLVQACMRMRKLGDGHSLCFLSPPEVHQSICDGRVGDTTPITSRDVLAWCMEQTCQAMDVAQPLRIMQGLEFSHRQKILNTYFPAGSSPTTLVEDEGRTECFWQGIQEDESQTLDYMYGVHDGRMSTFARLLDRNSDEAMMRHLVQEFDCMDNLVMEDSSMDNEQEREVAHESEQERQVERPGQVKPLTPEISKGLVEFIHTGTVDKKPSSGIFRAFQLFVQSSAQSYACSQKIDLDLFPLFATEDFARSVKLPTKAQLDEYLRPVNWVLTSLLKDEMVIISPHEANSLLPQIRASAFVRLHLFTLRTNKKMMPFDDMNFYTPSAHLDDRLPSAEAIRSLNLFSGTLYLNSLAEYEDLCHFLGIVTPSRRPKGREVSSDGFAKPSIRKDIGWSEECPFRRSPLPFLRQIFSLRMHGQDYDHTHMGSLVGAKALRDGAFDNFA